MESKEDLEKKIDELRIKVKELDNAEAKAFFEKWKGRYIKIQYPNSCVLYHISSFANMEFSGIKIIVVEYETFFERTATIFKNSGAEYYNLWLDDCEDKMKEITKEEFMKELPTWEKI